jgi:serine-type D-Ala-D-Ala carboxypeptidase
MSGNTVAMNVSLASIIVLLLCNLTLSVVATRQVDTSSNKNYPNINIKDASTSNNVGQEQNKYDEHSNGNYSAHTTWQDIEKLLNDAVKQHIFPGAIALVGNKDGILFEKAIGSYTYGQKTPLGQPNQPLDSTSSIFDMASCTKVVSTTSAVALLFQNNSFGTSGLQTKVGSILGDEYNTNGKSDITIENCLLHNAGFPPDPTPYDFWDPKFGCKGAPLPIVPNFDCSARAYNAIVAQSLDRPVGASYVYSDISFITLMYVVGATAYNNNIVTKNDFINECSTASSDNVGLLYQCSYEAYVRKQVFEKLDMKHTAFLPPKDVHKNCVPTTIPTGEPKSVENKCLQGYVNDGNAYMLGGIAGHAGLFSTVSDLSLLLNELMFNNQLFNETTVALFTKQYNHTQSSRALGWNTNDITAQPDGGWDESCGTLSPETFTHVGYTGSMFNF